MSRHFYHPDTPEVVQLLDQQMPDMTPEAVANVVLGTVRQELKALYDNHGLSDQDKAEMPSEEVAMAVSCRIGINHARRAVETLRLELGFDRSVDDEEETDG